MLLCSDELTLIVLCFFQAFEKSSIGITGSGVRSKRKRKGIGMWSVLWHPVVGPQMA